jgi:hypothetical protein
MGRWRCDRLPGFPTAASAFPEPTGTGLAEEFMTLKGSQNVATGQGPVDISGSKGYRP